MRKNDNKRSNKRAKHVVFDENLCQIMEIPIESNPNQRWYSHPEIDEMIASFIEAEESCDHLSSVRMDLTSKIQMSQFHSCQSRIQAQMNFVRGILAQQDEHKMHGIEDPQGLFQFSKSLSKSSRRIALEAAKSLALDCKNEIKPRELVKYIDNVLDILDFPLAEDY